MCQVVVKMDIEGSELEVMPDLLLSGAMKHIDLMFVEWHVGLSRKERKEMLREVNGRFLRV